MKLPVSYNRSFPDSLSFKYGLMSWLDVPSLCWTASRLETKSSGFMTPVCSDAAETEEVVDEHVEAGAKEALVEDVEAGAREALEIDEMDEVGISEGETWLHLSVSDSGEKSTS